ncbi:SpoIIE family protein phosphatase [Ruminococcus sp.]|uniref:SpoIIE family protein phosphatase n=1 Tax=Ruminococcus sp. TaxID=41978 RepID=UPI0025D1C06F|nr:SpoIIE family protein phosphatase [Ruminococcus sp.]MBQ8967437.1 SpoIIE family protein phosphatase [Ruminococcus sp.]
MKKLLGMTFGGLQQKILNLVLIFMLLIIGVFGAVSVYQSKRLTKIVSGAAVEQQEAIEKVSGETMSAVVNSTMTKTTALQAYIADDMFSEMRSDVATLQTLAEGLFEHRDSFEPYPYYPPDKANNGVMTAQVLAEEGVDVNSSEYLGVAAHMGSTMIAMCENSDYLSNCFIGLADGTLLCVDDNSANKFDENGNVTTFPVRERPWYTGAVEAGGLYFTGIERDTYTDKVGIECCAPVYVNGELIAVVGADLFLDSMAEYVDQSSANGGFIAVVNNDGQVIFAPENNGLFSVMTSDQAEDLRASENKDLAAFISSALADRTAVETVNVNGKDYYMAGSPMTTVGWAVVAVTEKDITEQPAKMMIDEFDRINDEATGTFSEGAKHSEQMIFIMIAVILTLGSIGAMTVANRIVKPISEMTNSLINSGKTGETFEMKDIYRTNDEIQVLAESFDDLSKKTKQYIQDITNITAEKERISTELELAQRIQADMLPNIFPAFPDRPEFDIYASMTPAKEVGGDFYDFFLIDDDHLGMVMADVSGKGVPAALFMMMSKILINNYAMMGGSPAKALEQTNTAICQNNEEEMFVTVWFGVLEISTGKITAANAGHEYPIIRKADGDFELFKDKHGFVIGGMDGIKYKEYEMTLEKGGTLFLYTDGVPEATDASNELFGTDRLLAAMNTMKDAAPKELLTGVKASVDKFVGEAPQFDDLTMMGIKML